MNSVHGHVHAWRVYIIAKGIGNAHDHETYFPNDVHVFWNFLVNFNNRSDNQEHPLARLCFYWLVFFSSLFIALLGIGLMFLFFFFFEIFLRTHDSVVNFLLLDFVAYNHNISGRNWSIGWKIYQDFKNILTKSKKFLITSQLLYLKKYYDHFKENYTSTFNSWFRRKKARYEKMSKKTFFIFRGFNFLQKSFLIIFSYLQYSTQNFNLKFFRAINWNFSLLKF